uniref:Uncharacterized protein n=1 Tax=Siphoviridae sp. ctgBD49 TaxID=2826420 RepID=A0A8S5QQC2_9CAUD|nr:MAG TPA: hypothetical protein [Siphoviridae sp. ctgBD49]
MIFNDYSGCILFTSVPDVGGSDCLYYSLLCNNVSFQGIQDLYFVQQSRRKHTLV